MGAKTSFKKQQFQDRIFEEVSRALRSNFSDVRLKRVSITKVEVSSDCSFAKIYWDTSDNGTRGDAKKSIERITGKMRSILADNLNVRHVPAITFIYDSQFEDEKKIEQILDAEAKLGKGTD